MVSGDWMHATSRKRMGTDMRMTSCIAAAAACVAMASAHPGAGRDEAAGVTVMTFNIQHAIDTIAKLQPELVGLQEVTRNHPYYNCDDQPAKIAEGLKAATGRAW